MRFPPKSDIRSCFLLTGVFLLIALAGLASMLSCTSTTGSSAGSGTGTGSGWTITITATPTAASTSAGENLGVVVVVRDRNGTPALKGTNICVNALRGGFVNNASETGLVIVSICATTTDDFGQAQVIYTPLRVADVEITPGSFRQMNVTISPGSDTITATGMGVSGTTTVQVLP